MKAKSSIYLITIAVLFLVFTGCGDTIPVTEITLNKDSASIFIGSTEQLEAVVSPPDATIQDITWTSSNEASASVSSQGIVTGAGAGSAIIRATTADGGYFAECDVTVTLPPPYKFVAAGSAGLKVFDVSDLGNPDFIAGVDTAGSARDAYVNGNYAYIADWTNGLVIFDISDPEDPVFKGHLGSAGRVNDVAVRGNIAYSASLQGGLEIIDVSDPENPVLKGSYNNTGGIVKNLGIAGDYVYATDYNSGLFVIDVSDPENPAFTGSYEIDGSPSGISINRDHACIIFNGNSNGKGGFAIIDISDPENPALKGIHEADKYFEGITASGNYAYTAGMSGLDIFDISNLENPALKKSFLKDNLIYSISINGNLAYIAGSDEFLIIDIGNPVSPALKGRHEALFRQLRGICVDGDYVYAADYYNGFMIADVSKPEDYVLKAKVDTGSFGSYGVTYGVTKSGNYAYVIDYNYQNLRIVDVSDPGSLVLKGGYDAPNAIAKIRIRGDYAYAANSYAGLLVLNVSDPENPVFAGSASSGSGGGALDISINEDYAYLAEYAEGISIFDISDPSVDPVFKGGYDDDDTDMKACNISVKGDYAYVADSSNGLVIIDVSDPENPALASSIDSGNYTDSVTVDGSYAFVGSSEGFIVVDISDPENPAIKGTYNISGTIYEISISGEYAYVGGAGFGGGFLILDISDPGNPAYVFQEGLYVGIF